MSTSKQLYCGSCGEILEHVKVSYTDVKALKKLSEERADKNDDLAARIYKQYPEWFKDVNFGLTAFSSVIINGLTQVFLGKDYASIWICSKCHTFQTRTLE